MTRAETSAAQVAFKVVVNGLMARPLARRNVRLGMPVQDAAWHATMSVMLYNAIGFIVILWCIGGLPLVLTLGDDRGIVLGLGRLVLIAVDTLTCFGFIGCALVWIKNNPRTISGWRRVAAQPGLILTLLVSIIPVHLLVLGLVALAHGATS